MTDYAELIERLEKQAHISQASKSIGLITKSRSEYAMRQAASAIRTLIAERDAARKANDTALAMAMQAGADAERERTLKP